MSEEARLLQSTGPVKVVPVVETIAGDLLTPLGVYLRLSRNSKNSFLLESVEGGESLARYSFIGADPEFVLYGDDKNVRISRANGEESLPLGVIDFLREYFGVRQFAAG